MRENGSFSFLRLQILNTRTWIEFLRLLKRKSHVVRIILSVPFILSPVRELGVREFISPRRRTFPRSFSCYFTFLHLRVSLDTFHVNFLKFLFGETCNFNFSFQRCSPFCLFFSISLKVSFDSFIAKKKKEEEEKKTRRYISETIDRYLERKLALTMKERRATQIGGRGERFIGEARNRGMKVCASRACLKKKRKKKRKNIDTFQNV